jgi:phosphoesterase RecJ-like protein
MKTIILNKIIDILKTNESFLITAHIFPDGDSLGSMLALGMFLKQTLNKQVDMVQDGNIPPVYDFLPGIEQLKSNQQLKSRYDVVICCECPDVSRIGNSLQHIQPGYELINIDHHKDNQVYGTVNWVEPKAAALSELIYEIMMTIDPASITRDIATCLYTAIFTDTGGFHYSNTSGDTLRISGALLEQGVNGWDIARRVYHTRSLPMTHLLGLMMANIQTINQGKLSYAFISREMFEKSGATPTDTEGFIIPVRAVEGIEIAILFQETMDGRVKISFRSLGHLDVAELAKKFGGGGHKMAAGAILDGHLDQVLNPTLEKVIRWME